MKHLVFAAILGLLISGCAAMEETYFIDREFGVATNDAFDQQIINKDYAHANQPVEGMPALHAEPVMGTYHSTFSTGFTKESIDINAVGSESGN